MASRPAFLIVLCAQLIISSNSQNPNSKEVYQTPSDCKTGSSSTDGFAEFFNSATLKCSQCSENSTFQLQSTDGLSCICQPGYRYVKNFGGKNVTCQLCPNAVSEDGWECITCGGGTNVNTNTRRCSECPNERTISALRQLNGNLIDPNKQLSCVRCEGETQSNSDQSKCNRCSYTLSLRATQSPPAPERTCNCTTSEFALNGICYPVENRITGLDFAIPLENENPIQSIYLRNNLENVFYMCRYYSNITACQTLANMCMLTMYSGGPRRAFTAANTPCNLFALFNTETSLNELKPLVFVGDLNADDELERDDIEIEWTMDPPMEFPFLAGTFTLDGNFLGFQEIQGNFLQLCEASDNILNAAFVFGTYYSYSCQISASSLWDEVKYPLRFCEIYLRYISTESGSTETIFKIPVLIRNYRDSSNNFANRESVKDWQLTRRFFLVDNVATKTAEGQEAPHVRYAKSITLRVNLLPDTTEGRISVPYFDIEYDDVSKERADNNEKVQIDFQVTYEMSQSAYKEDFQIAIGTISSLGVIYAGFRTYVWSRRAGRITIDFPTLANLVFYLCGTLSNCFFVVTYGIAFYFFIFFKRQNVVYLVHLEGKSYEEWYILFVSAFALKCAALLHMIVMQCSADIFMVDWERPKGQPPVPHSTTTGGGTGDGASSPKRLKSSVSIWRTYFVANEWNEIQTKRKINRVLQIFMVIFFLVVVGFEDTATKDPNGEVNKGSDVYKAEQSPMFRMALGATVYLLVAVVQVIFFVFIYERFISDDIREFVDLCSMSNISVFVMANGEFGYYIHGRSVHGRSDVGMREMCDMIKREEEDLVGQRGLVPNTEPQTFLMALPKRLRQKYETVYMPVQLENASAATRGEQARLAGRDKSIDAYGTLNRFFCAFIDHSLRDIDYVVKEKTFLEKILDTEFLELADKGIFYNDNGHSFDNVLFYGNEMMLIIFDTLFFCVVDYIFTDYVLAGILTYLITELICLIRDIGGKKNLAKKTLVDERFLI
ncbi:meckelin [Plakobranchus ocellatus]|uniref:Meckelin n=1 Tax=Plakobranchus ocellatus TaxID=259542 RepID=A0AAV3YUN1_9GAST|nr:meckelin [Plakobranchus ocellatus]